MIVADASAIFQVLGRASNWEQIESFLFDGAETIYAPHLLDAEIVSVLRRHVLAKQLGEPRARNMLKDYLDMTLTRLPHWPLLPRVFALRNTMSAYDAIYVSLAESLRATLVTRDCRLARAAEGLVAVKVF